MNTTAPSTTLGVIDRFAAHLPVSDATPRISLCEGSTSLIPSPKLSEKIGRGIRAHLKFEGLNPTGSFKDRGMTMAMSKAAEEGVRAVICASTGNTSAAAAAYAARAGIACIVLLPAGKIATGKLAQAYMYGAKVVSIDGNFDQGLELVREIGTMPGFAIVNSINPYRVQGQKTAAFEIIEALGRAPAAHYIPVGNGANIAAYWLGYREYHQLDKADSLPAMCGFQAEGSAPLVIGHPVKNPETIATAIRIGNPATWDGALDAGRDSGGGIEAVSDAEILAAQSWLAGSEGVFAEPASVAPVAGFLKQCANAEKLPPDHYFKKIPAESDITFTLTGNGLKDIDTALSGISPEPIKAEADKDEILRKLDLA